MIIVCPICLNLTGFLQHCYFICCSLFLISFMRFSTLRSSFTISILIFPKCYLSTYPYQCRFLYCTLQSVTFIPKLIVNEETFIMTKDLIPNFVFNPKYHQIRINNEALSSGVTPAKSLHVRKPTPEEVDRCSTNLLFWIFTCLQQECCCIGHWIW